MRLILALSTAILLLASASAAAEPAFPDLPELADTRTYTAVEPVFEGQVFIYEAGRHHPVSAVLIHGIGDEGARVWGRLIPELAREYHVVTCDLPGFGRSTKANHLYSPETYRDFIHWLINRCVKGPLVLFGHSMGGAVALAYAAAHPERIQKLVVVDAGGILHRLALTRYMVLDHDASPRTPEGYVTTWFNRFKVKAMEALEYPRLVDDIDRVLASPGMRKNLLGGDPSKISGLALVHFDFSALLPRIDTPTLVVWGADDAVTPLRTAKLLQAALPRVDLYVMPESGHLPMLDAPCKFNRRVMDTLQGTLSSTKPTVPAPTDRVVRYSGQNDVTITGGFKRIEISGCKGVRIVNATTEILDIARSEVDLEFCAIRGNDYAVSVISSQLTMTGVVIQADVALTASRSRLDMAGVEIVGRRKAVQALDPSDLLFSVSRIKSPLTDGYMHGPYEISHRNPL